MPRWALILIIAVLLLTPAVLIFTGAFSKSGQAPGKVTLDWWATEDAVQGASTLITRYERLHPYISIRLKILDPQDFDQQLKDAWARDEGPDMFSVPNTSLAGFQDFISPIPATTRVATYRTRRILFRTEREITYSTVAMLTPKQVNAEFVRAVGEDVIRKNARDKDTVFAIPFAMDTLMLFYNRDLLNSAGIIDPPTTWKAFSEQVPKLTILNDEDAIVRPAAGLGLAKNVPYAFDILSLLMMQNGAQMTDSRDRTVKFHQAREDGKRLGQDALEFFTDFAQIQQPKDVLTWAPTFPPALELFSQNKLAFAFGYQTDRLRIARENPSLNFGVAAIPHIQANGDNDATAPADDPLRKITYARYYVHTVAIKARKKANEAWNFLQYASRGNAGSATESFLKRTKQASARPTLLKKQQDDVELRVPAEQALTARSWYRGLNVAKAEDYFTTMIEDVAVNGADPGLTLSRTADQVQETLRP